MIFIVVKFNVKPEYQDTWMERVRPFTDAVREEPGNLWFEWSRSVEHPEQFVLIEAFRDADAGAVHVQTDHFKAAGGVLAEMVADVPDIVNVEIPGTEWSKMAEIGG